MRWSIVGLMLVAACGDGYLGRGVEVAYAPESAEAVLEVSGPIVTSRFPEDVAATTRTDASVFVINLTDSAVDYRQFVATMPSYDEATLTVRAPFAATPCGQFGFVILDNVRDAAHDERIGRTIAFNDAFEGKGPFGELRLALVQNGVELASVAGATLFSVSCP